MPNKVEKKVDAVDVNKMNKDAAGKIRQALDKDVDNDSTDKVGKMTIAEKAVDRKEQPRKRVPLGTRNRLTAPKNPGFVRRFVNDKDDRIQAFKDAGWKVVDAGVKIGDEKIGRATSLGSSASPSVGGGQRAVLMEIPEKYYKEDEKAKQARIAKVEKELSRNKPGQDGLEGKVSVS